jgi:hypothetical protein
VQSGFVSEETHFIKRHVDYDEVKREEGRDEEEEEEEEEEAEEEEDEEWIDKPTQWLGHREPGESVAAEIL